VASRAGPTRAARAPRWAIKVTDTPIVRLNPGHAKRVRAGHPWVFSNEIAMDAAAKALAPGTVVRLADSNGAFLASAMFNPHSLIAARVLSRERDESIDRAFLKARIQSALHLRERLYPDPFYRLIHAEADGLPGLVIDRFARTLVVEVGSAGMDALTTELLAALEATVAPHCVILRNDSPVRTLEGLILETRVALGGTPDGPIALSENGARFFADPMSGQKTGWFYDQRESRARVAALATGARVLDAYCYTGGFGMLAAMKGAAQVTCVDRSQPALDLAAMAADANGVTERCRFVRGEAFDTLERMDETFDVVIADPPAFVRSKKDLGAGLRGYRKLMRLAAQRVAPGGFLFAASCSHHVTPEAFAKELAHALADAGRAGRVIAQAGAGPDHPVHPQLPESAYLKSLLVAL
jgi:23S rRNA (cytosine1962-C5)-methyltransferase